ncbi:substrate-binding periplasmic protein [Siminovitchia acidinfaciens]|nr:transporter substrate-binding domain-containing protein [Siminovitchia acidinfaciens]
MKNMKLLITLIIAVAMLFVSACSSSNAGNEGESKSESSASGGNVYSKIQDKGVIEVGSTPSGPPFTFLNTKTNEIDGFMVDIVKSVGEELDLDVNINSVQWASLIPSMDAEKLDMVAAAMAITEERKKVLDFSEPVYTYGESIITLKDNDDINSFEDLEGFKVGVQEASIYYTGVQEHPELETQTYKTHQDMAKELQNGRIDAFFADYPVFKEMVKELPDLKDKVKIIKPEDPRWVAEIALALPKGEKEFQEDVNKKVAEMKESGELEELIKKWGLD